MSRTLLLALLLSGCASSLADRCRDKGERLLDEAYEHAGDAAELARYQRRLDAIHERCSYALEAMAAAEEVLR